MRTEEARPVRLEDYRPPDWRVETVELDVSLDPTATRVRATLMLAPNGDGAAPAPLVLDGDGLTLAALKIDGAPLPPEQYVATADRLTIAQPPQQPFRLEIETVVDPSANTQLMGLYRSGPIYCTQCEAEGFRRITYFPDRPDVMAVYTTRIEAEKADAPVLLANGNLISSGDLPGTTRHFAVWHDPFPKPSYLFALVGGKLACVDDSFTTMSGRKVALKIYVEPGKEARCAYAMDSLKRAMRWDETAFGREYDLDIFMIVAVSDFNMGAMENKGLNVFNDKYVLASPETATDTDFERIEAIIAHEYFHNWTGNRITCRDWFQLCLKEGLTVFRDEEFTADERSRAVERIGDVRGLRAHQFVEDAGPLAHPVRPKLYHEINNFYTATVYEKGAEVVRMIKALLGPENFRKGMDLYFTRHDGEAATIEQFVQCFADVSGADLTQFMLWYSQAGTPEVVATGNFDARAKTYRLDVAQTVPADPRPAEQGADGHPARHRPRRPRRTRPAARARRRARDRARHAHLDQARRELRVRRHRRAAGALAQPWIFGADQAHRQRLRRRPEIPRRARRRCVQSLAGAADAGDKASGRQHRGRARGEAPCAGTPASSTRSARCWPTARSSRLSSRSCWHFRERPILRARSAATSIPTRSSRRARRCAARSASNSARRCSITTAGSPRAALTVPTRRAPAGAHCATPASISWWRRAARMRLRSPPASTRRQTT